MAALSGHRIQNLVDPLERQHDRLRGRQWAHPEHYWPIERTAFLREWRKGDCQLVGATRDGQPICPSTRSPYPSFGPDPIEGGHPSGNPAKYDTCRVMTICIDGTGRSA